MIEDGDDPESEEVEAIVNGIPMRRKKLRVKLVNIWENLSSTIASAPARCVAWDECIGRMCVALENDSRIFVVDFAQAPKEGALLISVPWPKQCLTLTAPLPLTGDDGERLPVPVRSYQNPTQSGFFGKLLKTLRL